MPTPGENESEKDFISRCIPIVMEEDSNRSNEQATAICYSIWERKNQKKAELAEFSLVIRSVGLNKNTGERYWKASTSDIFPDKFNDEMSLELYNSFISKIETHVKPPQHFCSNFWDGGLPYVSVSHYREHSIAGDTDKIYIDGSVLKAKGTFRDNPIGRACFEALCTDLYGKEMADEESKIRVSISFIDFKHKHKSNGFVFERSTIEDICPECLDERIKNKHSGLIFLDGLLIHFAMTRVPVNTRTLMEVEKSMTTKKEDAESIVGQELANEIDEKEKSLVGKSEALVTKADETKEKPVVVEKPTEEPIKEPEEPVVVSGIERLFSRLEALDKRVEELFLKVIPAVKSDVVEVVSHPLDEALAQLKSDFTSVSLSDDNTEGRLRALQPTFDAVGARIKKLLEVPESKSDVVPTDSRLLEVLQKLSDKVDLLASQQRSQVAPSAIPSPRSINPATVPQIHNKPAPVQSDGVTPPLLRSIIDRSVGIGQ